MSGNGVFNNVSANGMNVTGILQASQIVTTQPMQVGDIKTLVKSQPVVTDNSVFADLMATTPAGRIALAKALGFGQNANIFIENKYTPLLANGYSGKGVLYGHCERGLNFRTPGLVHHNHPEHIFITSGNAFANAQMANFNVSYPMPSLGGALMDPHPYACSELTVGFNLHAKLSDVNFGLVNEVNYDKVASYSTWSNIYPNGNSAAGIYNSDGFIMGPAYNADLVDLQVQPGYNNNGGDPDLITQFPSMRESLDDMYVEVMEKAFYRGVLVAACPQGWANLNSTYNYYPESSRFDGVGNPITYINSLAADHNMVFCVSASNEVHVGTGGLDVPEDNGGSGRMALNTDGRNIFSVGTKMLGDLSTYGLTSASVTVFPQDYALRRYWSNIAPGAPETNTYTTSNVYSQGGRVIKPYHSYGRTVDKAGPGETNRVKPDILSAQGGPRHMIAWPKTAQADNTNNWLYATLFSAATSGTVQTLAGGVCLLREALPRLDAHQIRECIMLTASNGNLTDANTYNGYGYGLINLEAALAYGQARTHQLPPKLTAGSWLYSEGFQANVLAGNSNTLSPFQPFTQFGVSSNTFSPKSVQSFKCPRDDALYDSASPSYSATYKSAYDTYTTAYNTYVAYKPSLWTGKVLDLSPVRGLWGSSATRSFEEPTFEVVSTRSWISTSLEDLQEISDLMVANGIKVCVTSQLLGAISVEAESIEQLSAVVNGNTKIHGVFPVMTVQISDNWDFQ
jgi:hypothetical protein